MVLVYKIINNLVDLDICDFFDFDISPYNLRRHNFYFKKPSCKLDVSKYFFTNRVINPWNSLPSNVVNAPSLDLFRKRLNCFNIQTVQTMIFWYCASLLLFKSFFIIYSFVLLSCSSYLFFLLDLSHVSCFSWYLKPSWNKPYHTKRSL